MEEEFKIDLDAENFIGKATEATEAMESFMEAGNKIGKLIETIEELGAVLAPIIITMLALKEAMSLVFEGEQIKAVNQQFEILAETAGVVPEQLKNGMIEAAHGMMTEMEAIEATNKALVKLQTGFEELPKIMELSRQVAAVMGGTITERFDQITQAVATGQTRMLRSAGIIVDQQKAYREYANSIGVAADTLSKAGQQQAMLNAIMEASEGKFGKVNADVKEATNTWTQIKVSVKEFGEGFAEMFEKIAGKYVTDALKGINSAIKDLALTMKSNFGEGAEAAAAKVETLKRGIQKTTDEIAAYQRNANEQEKAGNDAVFNARMAGLERIKARMEADLKAQTANLEKVKAEEEAKKPEAEGGAEASKVDLAKQAEQKAKFAADMEKLDKQITDEEIKNMQSVSQATELYRQKQKDEVAKIDAEIAKLDAEGDKGQILTRAQADQEIMKLEEIKNQKIIKSDEELRKMQNKALDNYLAHSTSVTDGVARGFQAMSQKNQIAIKDYGAFGERTAKSFENHSVSAIQGVATGTKSATEAMGEMFGGMVGDMATDYGKMLLLSSIWPPNPAGMAAGIGLIALGAELGTLGGGSHSGSSGGTGSISGIGAASTATPMNQAANQATIGKSVTLVVQGHMMMNDQSARWVTDQVRNAADATDFKVQSVGGGL